MFVSSDRHDVLDKSPRRGARYREITKSSLVQNLHRTDVVPCHTPPHFVTVT